MVEKKRQMDNEGEIRLEGELRSISPSYQSVKGIEFNVARLVDNESREFILFFWDNNVQFDYDAKLKIKGLTVGEQIAVYARKRINPKDGQEVYNVIRFAENSEEEAEIF